MLLCEQPAKAPKDSNLNPPATEQQQAVCVQNFASPSDLNLKFWVQLLSGLIAISENYMKSSECWEKAKVRPSSAQQPRCEHRVSCRWESHPWSSLGARTQLGLPWACCCSCRQPFCCPLCCIPGTGQGWHCPGAQGEAEQLQTAGTLDKEPATQVNGDVSTFRLCPAQPCSCCSEPLHLGVCVQLSTKAVRTWRLKYLICLSRKDLLTQTRACDEILFTRQVWGWKSIEQNCCGQKLDSLSEQNSLKQAMPHITPFAWLI